MTDHTPPPLTPLVTSVAVLDAHAPDAGIRAYALTDLPLGAAVRLDVGNKDWIREPRVLPFLADAAIARGLLVIVEGTPRAITAVTEELQQVLAAHRRSSS